MPSCRISEITGDLFTVDNKYSLAHCVAADMRMGKGIAVKFKNIFGQLDKLKNQNIQPGGVAILKDRDRYVYYLVTKQSSYGKPTYQLMESSLIAMRDHMQKNGINKLAIPRIGCGLDGLVWSKVEDQLREIFAETPVEIVVYNFSATTQK